MTRDWDGHQAVYSRVRVNESGQRNRDGHALLAALLASW